MTFSFKTVSPKINAFDFGEDPSNVGESATLQCTVISGDFPVYMRWLLNGEVIEDNDRFLGISISQIGKRASAISIDSVADNHAGNYTCEASNKAGVARHSTILIVNG